MDILFRIKSYLRYLQKAKGLQGLHSPFVYKLAEHVFYDERRYYSYSSIESERRKLLQNRTEIEVADYGAGSVMLKSPRRKIAQIALNSLKSRKYGQLLFRLTNRFQPRYVVEIGTSLGITTSYLAMANTKAEVITLEGCQHISAHAKQVFNNLALDNVTVKQGNFDETLPDVLSLLPQVDMAFIDGNHKKEPTLQYFDWLTAKCHNDSLVVVDDIYWSEDMGAAWAAIKKSPKVTVTVDLYGLGLVFFRKEQAKQDFVVRF